MGFAFYYRSAEPVDAETRAAVDAACEQLCSGRTWLSCEPLCFLSAHHDGYMTGRSKPNFMPHPDDVDSAESEGLRDGTIGDVLDVLCGLSRDFNVDWEVSHDYSDGPIGFIRDGQADREVVEQIEALPGVDDIIGDYGLGAFGLLGVCGVNIWYGGPLDPRREREETEGEDGRPA